jgi:protein phosphatase
MLMSVNQKIEAYALTDSGSKRTHNEDSVAADPRLGLVIVADGMGGYKGGEVASALAVNTIMSELESTLERFHTENANMDSEFSLESLAIKDVLELSNSIIYNAAQSQPQYSGMGTTVVLALFYDNRMTIAHVGDSRLYRLRNDVLELVTEDHTLLRELISRGFYSEEEAKESQNKNLVTRALGIESSVEIDIQEDVALPGDIYLLCSDGLNDMVDDRDIHLTLKRYNDSLDTAVAELIQLAKNNGGKDNVSVVLARPTRVSSSPKHWTEKVVDWFF